MIAANFTIGGDDHEAHPFDRFAAWCDRCRSGLAALKPGDKAPEFTTQATLGGNEFTFRWPMP